METSSLHTRCQRGTEGSEEESGVVELAADGRVHVGLVFGEGAEVAVRAAAHCGGEACHGADAFGLGCGGGSVLIVVHEEFSEGSRDITVFLPEVWGH